MNLNILGDFQICISVPLITQVTNHIYVLMGAIYLYCAIRVLPVKYFFFHGLFFKKGNYVRFLKDGKCDIQYLVKQRRQGYRPAGF